MIVVDASVIVELVLNSQAAPRIRDRLTRRQEMLAAPHLIDLEVIQALRRFNASGDLDEHRASESLRGLKEFRLQRYPHHPFAERIWQLRRNTTAYDAAYVALAEALEATLLTRDARLAAAPGGQAVIELI